MNKIDFIVIEDEFMNRDLIMNLIPGLNEKFNSKGCAENIDEGFKLINSVKPHVIFLDIKMPGGNGFDLLRKFSDRNFEVVFVTGFDEYAIQAFEFNALDYILKPIDPTKLELTLEKVYSRIQAKISFDENVKNAILGLDSSGTIISKIPVHFNDRVILIDVQEIVSIQSDNGYTLFSMRGGEKYISSKQLSSFEFIVEPYQTFVKVNKSVFLNLNYVKSYSKGQTCIISLTDNSSFEVSRRKKTEILAILSNTF